MPPRRHAADTMGVESSAPAPPSPSPPPSPPQPTPRRAKGKAPQSASTAVWRPPGSGGAKDVAAILGPRALESVDGLAALAALDAASSADEYLEATRRLLDLVAESVEEAEMRAAVVFDHVVGLVWPTAAAAGGEGTLSAAATAALTRRPLPTQSEAAFRLSLAPRTRAVLDRGNSTARAQRAALKTIVAAWGEDWFQRIPSELLAADHRASPYALSTRLIKGIARVAAAGSAQNDTVAALGAIVRRRNADTKRRKSVGGLRGGRVAPFLSTSDITAFEDASAAGTLAALLPRQSGRRDAPAGTGKDALSDSRVRESDEEEEEEASGSGSEAADDPPADPTADDEDGEDAAAGGGANAPGAGRKRPLSEQGPSGGRKRPRGNKGNVVDWLDRLVRRPLSVGEANAYAARLVAGLEDGRCPATELATQLAPIVHAVATNCIRVLDGLAKRGFYPCASCALPLVEHLDALATGLHEADGREPHDGGSDPGEREEGEEDDDDDGDDDGEDDDADGDGDGDGDGDDDDDADGDGGGDDADGGDDDDDAGDASRPTTAAPPTTGGGGEAAPVVEEGSRGGESVPMPPPKGQTTTGTAALAARVEVAATRAAAPAAAKTPKPGQKRPAPPSARGRPTPAPTPTPGGDDPAAPPRTFFSQFAKGATPGTFPTDRPLPRPDPAARAAWEERRREAGAATPRPPPPRPGAEREGNESPPSTASASADAVAFAALAGNRRAPVVRPLSSPPPSREPSPAEEEERQPSPPSSPPGVPVRPSGRGRGGRGRGRGRSGLPPVRPAG